MEYYCQTVDLPIFCTENDCLLTKEKNHYLCKKN